MPTQANIAASALLRRTVDDLGDVHAAPLASIDDLRALLARVPATEASKAAVAALTAASSGGGGGSSSTGAADYFAAVASSSSSSASASSTSVSLPLRDPLSLARCLIPSDPAAGLSLLSYPPTSMFRDSEPFIDYEPGVGSVDSAVSIGGGTCSSSSSIGGGSGGRAGETEVLLVDNSDEDDTKGTSGVDSLSAPTAKRPRFTSSTGDNALEASPTANGGKARTASSSLRGMRAFFFHFSATTPPPSTLAGASQTSSLLGSSSNSLAVKSVGSASSAAAASFAATSSVAASTAADVLIGSVLWPRSDLVSRYLWPRSDLVSRYLWPRNWTYRVNFNS